MIGFNSISCKVVISSALAMTASAAFTGAASANTTQNFVVNGGFEQATVPSGQLEAVTKVTGWTAVRGGNLAQADAERYVFLTDADSASAPGMLNRKGNYTRLAGPGNGHENGMTASPQGGNFIAMDANFNRGAISQLVEGLTVGEKYTLSFDFAGAQNISSRGNTETTIFFGLTSDPFGYEAANKTGPVMKNTEFGFVDWDTYTFDFIADSAISYLYFFARGAPSGQPPFALLDNVSLTGPHAGAVPEPATWAMMIVGFGAVGGVMRRRAREQRLTATS